MIRHRNAGAKPAMRSFREMAELFPAAAPADDARPMPDFEERDWRVLETRLKEEGDQDSLRFVRAYLGQYVRVCHLAFGKDLTFEQFAQASQGSRRPSSAGARQASISASEASVGSDRTQRT